MAVPALLALGVSALSGVSLIKGLNTYKRLNSYTYTSSHAVGWKKVAKIAAVIFCTTAIFGLLGATLSFSASVYPILAKMTSISLASRIMTSFSLTVWGTLLTGSYLAMKYADDIVTAIKDQPPVDSPDHPMTQMMANFLTNPDRVNQLQAFAEASDQ